MSSQVKKKLSHGYYVMYDKIVDHDLKNCHLFVITRSIS